VKIRTVNAEDLWEVARIESESFGTPWTFPQLVAQYERNRQGFLVAEEKEKIAGFSIADPGGLLMLIAVDSKHRRKGTGSKLLAASITFLKENKTKKAFAQVRQSNKDAIDFYVQHGFKKEKALPGYYSGEDGLLLTKKLV
jgi:ribosomal protein S18 acetylase RimI-like enzyme